MPDIKIIPANVSDAAKLSEYMGRRFSDTFGHIYDPDDLKQFLIDKYNIEITTQQIRNPENFIYIAWLDDEIKGYIFGGPMGLPFKGFAANSYELYRLYVSDDQKGKGVAKQLYKLLLEYVETINAPELYLGVWSQNERAKAFYTGLGFEIVGKYLYQVGKTFDDERIMRKKL